jgi:hypothetical protein
MSTSKSVVRYIGYQSRPDGGRGFDFSITDAGMEPTTITVEASAKIFAGPDRIAIQEALGICYETLKCRILAEPKGPPDHFDLTATDVVQHRKYTKPHGRR